MKLGLRKFHKNRLRTKGTVIFRVAVEIGG